MSINGCDMLWSEAVLDWSSDNVSLEPQTVKLSDKKLKFQRRMWPLKNDHNAGVALKRATLL